MMRARLLILLTTTALSACVVGPDYRLPTMTMPAAYAGTDVQTKNGSITAGNADLDAWWAQFGDPELSALIARATQDNLDLRTAVSRIREAREQQIIAGAAGLPTLNADANVARTYLSRNAGLSQIASQFGGGQGGGQGGAQGGGQQGGGGIALPGGAFTTYTIGFDASWELDVFGGVRRSVEAAEAMTEKAVWTARDSEVSVAAEVASDYLTLRTLQRQIAVAEDEIRRQRQTLAVTEARREWGFVTDLDVHQQRAQLASTQATLPDLHAQVAAQIHALGVLVGEQPEALDAELAAPAVLPPPPPEVPVGLPSDLLRRRPDIRAAERALAASNAQIGVAVADLYPKFDLTGMLDLVSLDLRHLLDLSSRQYSGTGAISWPLFAGGKIHANIRASREENLQALYAYQKTVLAALQDVEDALTRYGDERQKNQALHEELVDAQGAADIAFGQYRVGLTDFTPVLSAQGTVLNARNQLAQSDGALDRDRVSLYKALGGGWSSVGQTR